jgi:hypothetical protein
VLGVGVDMYARGVSMVGCDEGGGTLRRGAKVTEFLRAESDTDKGCRREVGCGESRAGRRSSKCSGSRVKGLVPCSKIHLVIASRS